MIEPQGNRKGVGRMLEIGVLAGLKESGPEDVLPALEALRQRHPEVLPQVWREMLAGNGLAAGPTLLECSAFLAKVGNPPPMLIEGLLPDKSLFLLSGKPKAGKSFLALDIADGVREGGTLWGKYRVNRPGPVVYLGMEDGEYEIANRLLARERARTDTTSRFALHICAERFVLSDGERLASLQGLLQAVNPSLLIVDTAAEALGIRDWLNRSEITEKVGLLRDLARQICAVLLVSHNRKSEGEAGDEIAGSNAFTGAVDGWISAYRAEALPSGNRRLFLRTEGRGGVRGELAVEMDTQTLRFTALSAEEAAAGKEEAARDEMAAKIARAIEEYGGKATVKQISDWLEWPYSTIGRHVRQLAASGFLAATGERKAEGGRAGTLYCLEPSAHSF